VLTVRDPVQQTAAMHRVFCQLDPARMCPALDTTNRAHINYKKCTPLSDFARRGFAGAAVRAPCCCVGSVPMLSCCSFERVRCRLQAPLSHAGARWPNIPKDCAVQARIPKTPW